MAPPLFADLGKATRDVFDKGHILDVFKLNAKNNTCGSLKMKTELVHKFEDGSFKGNVEGNYPYPQYGLTLTKRWNTDNVIGLAAELANKIYPGITFKVEGTFAPDTGIKRATTTLNYKHDNVQTQLSIASGTDNEDKTVLDASLVAGYEGWLSGTRLEFNQTENLVRNHYIGVGHSYGSLQAFIIAQNWQLFTTNIYQRVTNRLEMGLSFGADMGEEKKQFYRLGARYLLNEDNSVRVKLDNESMIGLSLESTIQGSVKLIFSTLIDGKKLGEGGHKFGIGVDIM